MVRDVHLDTASSLQRQGISHHAGNEEHEARENLEETGSDGATTGAGNDFLVVLAGYLTQNTLNNVLVSTPVPETDNGSTEEYHIARELRVHGVGGIGVEHVSRSESIMRGIASGHHCLPTCDNAPIAQGSKTQEQYQEGAYNKDGSLDSGKRHHTFHSAEYREYCRYGYQSDGADPEVQSQQILEEDTSREGRNRNFRQHVSNQGNDTQPRTCALGVTHLQEIGHGDNLAHLVNHKLIEGNKYPAENKNHPALHFPMGHTHAILCSSTS